MTSICRLCASLKKVENFVNLRDPDLNLCHKLEKCCSLYIKDHDNLPQNVCFDCIECLEKSWKFYIKVQDAQESLINVFGQQSQECKRFDEKQEKQNVLLLEKLRKNSMNENIITYSEIQSKSQNQINKIEDDNSNEFDDDVELIQVAENDMKVEEFDVGDLIEQGEDYYDDDDDEDNNEQIDEQQQVYLEEYNEVKNENDDTSGGDIIDEDGNYEEIEEINEEQIEDEQNVYEEIGNVYEEYEIIEDDGNLNYDNNNIIVRDTWNDYSWKCIKCNLFLTNATNLDTHFHQVHNDNPRIFYCIDCMKIFSKYYLFINHVRFRHRKYLQLCCDICYRYLDTMQELSHHRTVNHPEESLSLVLCPTCGKAFQTLTALQTHSNCHKPDEMKYKYKCEFCGKKFGTKPNLKAHKKIHEGVREFVCDQCGKDFIQKANLEEHLLTHKNDCPYECEECHKRFKTSARLTKHKITHTDVKPYECQICGRLFREKDTLKVHNRIHTGAMPFECEYCGKRFRFKSILSTHRHQHTGVRPYSCNECNHHFTNWPNYNKHMKRRHGIDTSSTARNSQNRTTSKTSTIIMKQQKIQEQGRIELTSDSGVSGAGTAVSTTELVTSTTEISNFKDSNTY